MFSALPKDEQEKLEGKAFENVYGLTINDIGINYDVANHLIYANDTPTNAFTAMRSRIAQIHINDTYEDLDETECGTKKSIIF